MPFTWETMHEMYLEMQLYKVERETAEYEMKQIKRFARLTALSVGVLLFAIAYDFIVSFKMN